MTDHGLLPISRFSGETLQHRYIADGSLGVVILLTLCEPCCGMGRYIADAFCGRTRYIADASIVISLTLLLKKTPSDNTLSRLSTAVTRARVFLTFKDLLTQSLKRHYA